LVFGIIDFWFKNSGFFTWNRILFFRSLFALKVQLLFGFVSTGKTQIRSIIMVFKFVNVFVAILLFAFNMVLI